MSCKRDFPFQFLKFKRRVTSLALSHSLIHYLSASATMKTAYKSYSVAFKLEAISTAKREHFIFFLNVNKPTARRGKFNILTQS